MPTMKRPKHRRLGMRAIQDQQRPNFRQLIAAKCHWRCYYCGVRLGDEAGTIDHLTPIKKGGTTCESNCVLACKPCNNAKGQHDLAWYRHLCGVAQFPGEQE